MRIAAKATMARLLIFGVLAVLMLASVEQAKAQTDPCACLPTGNWTYLDPSKPRHIFSGCSLIPGETALGAAAAVCQVSDSCPIGNGVFNPEWSDRNGGRPGIKFKFCILSNSPPAVASPRSPAASPRPSPIVVSMIPPNPSPTRSPSPVAPRLCPCSNILVRYTPAGGGPVINMIGCTQIAVEPDASIVRSQFGTSSICLVEFSCDSPLAQTYGTNTNIKFQPCNPTGGPVALPSPSPVPVPSPTAPACPCSTTLVRYQAAASGRPIINIAGCTQISAQPDSDLLTRRFGVNTICLVDSSCTSPNAMTLPGSSSPLLFQACNLTGTSNSSQGMASPSRSPSPRPSPSPLATGSSPTTSGRCPCSSFPLTYIPSTPNTANISIVGCTTVSIQPDAEYLNALLGSNTICLAQTGCTSPTTRPLTPGSSLLFETCVQPVPPGSSPVARPSPPAGGRCPCSFFPGTYYPSDASRGSVPLNGCTTISFQPDAAYIRNMFGTNSICIVQTGCTSPTARPLSPSSSLLFEACTPEGQTAGSPVVPSPSPRVVVASPSTGQRSPSTQSPVGSPVSTTTPTSPTADRCPCSRLTGTYIPSDPARGTIPLNGCTTISFQPDEQYIRNVFGTNSICIAQTGCTSPTARILYPPSSLLFEPCTPGGQTAGSPVAASPSAAVRSPSPSVVVASPPYAQRSPSPRQSPVVPATSPTSGRCPCSSLTGTFIPSDPARGTIPLNGCTTISFQPDAQYIRNMFGTNSICIALTGCTSPTTRALTPTSNIFFEACEPSGPSPPESAASPTVRSPMASPRVSPVRSPTSPPTGGADPCACSNANFRYFPIDSNNSPIEFRGCTTITVQPDAEVLNARVGSSSVCLVSGACSSGVALDPSSSFRFLACTP